MQKFFISLRNNLLKLNWPIASLSCIFLMGFISHAETISQAKSFSHQIMGNGGDSLEAYEKVMRQKCNGPVLAKCSSLKGDLEAIHLCLYSKFQELSGDCSMFLSNTPMKYPPLEKDMNIGGILLPKGAVILKNKGVIAAIDIPKPWKFSNKSCGKGTVTMKTWDVKPGATPEVYACSAE